MTESDLLLALAQRYAGDEWAFFAQVPDATGFQGNRTADAIAMNLWPSRGLSLYGFEIKVSRNDWLSELKDPAKSAVIQQFCDFWWIVVPSTDTARQEELPPTWGLMVMRGGKLAVKKQAPKLEAKPLDRAFIASILRKAKAYVRPDDLLAKQITASYDTGVKVGKAYADHMLASEKKKVETLEQAISDFQKASGVTITKTWNAGNIAAAVQMVLDRPKMEELLRDLELLAGRAKTLSTTCHDALAILKAT